MLSPGKVKLVILKLKVLLENSKVKKIKKYKPPIHWDEDLHKINVGSRYLIFSNIVNPVAVKPDIDSKKALTKLIWKLLK